MGEKFSSTELSVSTVVNSSTTDVSGIDVTATMDSTSIVGNVSISVMGGCVDGSVVLVGGIVVVMGASVVTGVDIVVDVVVVVVVEEDVVDAATVVCSMGAGCSIIGACIITCTIDGDGCIMLLGMIGIWAFNIGNSGMGGVKKICEFDEISGCRMIQ